jgi:hypothetical protein
MLSPSTTTIVSMSSTIDAAAIAAIQKNYRTHYIRSWYEYQRVTPSHLHSIEHYNAACEEHASLYEKHIMVLRDNVTKITGWHYTTGWPAQNCADTDGYVDVRTGKKYTLQGENSFFKDIGK